MNLSRALVVPFGMAMLASCHAQEIRSDAPISESPSSLEVLSKAAEAYQNLKSYQDEGVAVTKFERTIADLTTECHFTTAFSRSGQFRFEFTELGVAKGLTRYVVWKNGDDVKSWWTIKPKIKRHENLGSAIAGATGVSGGTAYTIPSVLMKEAAWKGGTWTSPVSTYRISDGVERDVACFRIQRLTSTQAEKRGGIETPATTGKVTYWVSKDEFLLLRIDNETDFGSFLTKGTIQYFPTINSPVPDTAFEFGH
jgi:hypothetical protein